MTCETIDFGGGVRGVICGPFPAAERCLHGHPATALCDYRVGKRRTCDAPLCDDPQCEGRAHPVGIDRDLCQRHEGIEEVRAEMRAAATPLQGELPL